jgi:hypothetical protein
MGLFLGVAWERGFLGGVLKRGFSGGVYENRAV